MAELFTCLLIRSINCILCNSTIDCEALCGLGGRGVRSKENKEIDGQLKIPVIIKKAG